MACCIFIAFDLGAESGRAMLGILNDEKLRIEEVYRFSNIPVRINSNLYWDALRIWSEMKTAISKAKAVSKTSLTSMGVDTWGVDFALIDKNGELLGNPHHYRDVRTNGVMEEIFKKIPREEVYYRTGIQFLRFNTLYQIYSMILSKSPILHYASKFLMMPDLFNYWLCSSKVSEFTDATTTQFYNPAKKDWDYELLEELGIPTHFLPEIVKPGTLLGEVSHSLSNELKIDKGISTVAPACHDTASAVAAAPLRDKSSVYISSGTWSLIGVETDNPVINRKSLEYNFTNEGGVFGKFRLLQNVQGMWLLQECRRIWASQGMGFSYEELMELARRSRPFVAMINPDDPRFIAPFNMVEEIMHYLEETKQDKPKNEGELTRVILESLAFKYRFVIERLEDLTGLRISQINVVGGGSRNRLLNQLAADITGLKVVAGPAEATSIGNVLMQAVAIGFVKTHKEVRSIVERSFELEEFEPSFETGINDFYTRFVELVKKEGSQA
ncbi:MAG: rhamnulokinase family protein [Thermoproteota archaeon]